MTFTTQNRPTPNGTIQTRPIRRRPDGTIDAEHYTRRAERMRRFAWRKALGPLNRKRRSLPSDEAIREDRGRRFARG
jgi:hypothetical protein